jgi:hypothetical protein
MFAKIKFWFNFLKTLPEAVAANKARLSALEGWRKDCTSVAVDIPFGDPATIIVIGRVGRTDIVQTYNVHNKTFPELLGYLKLLEKNAHVTHIDATPEIKGYFLKAML